MSGIFEVSKCFKPDIKEHFSCKTKKIPGSTENISLYPNLNSPGLVLNYYYVLANYSKTSPVILNFGEFQALIIDTEADEMIQEPKLGHF